MTASASITRRNLFSILPAGAAGCLACQAAAQGWTEPAGMTWEEVFRFSFQRNFIPLMKAIGERIGNEKLLGMLKEATSEMATKGMQRNRIPNRNLATWVAGLKSPPPHMQHALVFEIVEDSPKAFEFRISQCLWAKAFREEQAADLGYAAICYPDYAVATGFNPKLKLIRTKTLMQGHDCCNHRYVMEG
jgi:hypothetical protein